ncbi:hypothetical protein [Sedimentitalea nanhaiensis]|uniref:hypothetical protein n=1 Tax=Sedimentitalea nanhaiensis TaxID=999627 RepID=UPI0012B5B75C|nr:hypothetical protein [Sedimentitalea nanhaiensis]
MSWISRAPVASSPPTAAGTAPAGRSSHCASRSASASGAAAKASASTRNISRRPIRHRARIACAWVCQPDIACAGGAPSRSAGAICTSGAS